MSVPIGWTCPKIDSVLKDIHLCLGLEDVDVIHDILNGLVGRYGVLEEIREANSTLRDWGEKMEDQLISAQGEVDRLEKEYSVLENEYEDVYNELQELLRQN